MARGIAPRHVFYIPPPVLRRTNDVFMCHNARVCMSGMGTCLKGINVYQPPTRTFVHRNDADGISLMPFRQNNAAYCQLETICLRPVTIWFTHRKHMVYNRRDLRFGEALMPFRNSMRHPQFPNDVVTMRKWRSYVREMTVMRGKTLAFGQKKWSTAVLQPFVNLKSNTMKNTMQRYVWR